MNRIQISFFIISSLVISSCDRNDSTIDTNELIGKWVLAEVNINSGLGNDVNPDLVEKNIVFHTDNTFISNTDLCSPLTNEFDESKGTYSILDSTINPTNCSKIYFDLSQSDLFIRYQCFEGCYERYIKQN